MIKSRLLFFFLSLLVCATAYGRPAVAADTRPALADTVKQYWEAVSKRDWDATYAIELEEDPEIQAEPQPGAPSASAEQRSPEQKKVSYVMRKHRSLSRMVAYEILEITEDAQGETGTARLNVRMPVRESMGYAQEQLSFVEHWVLRDGKWRRIGTKGGGIQENVQKRLVPAPGVRSRKTDEERAKATAGTVSSAQSEEGSTTSVKKGSAEPPATTGKAAE